MSYQSIFITKPCKIHIKNDNLIITQEGEDNHLTLDNISSIVIETTRATLTTYAISKLAEKGIALLYVDKKYQLNAITLPFHSHSTFSKIVHAQIAISKPIKKQLWQILIKQKIKNQAAVLEYFKKEKAVKQLRLFEKSVKSDDGENVEAKAARLYWSELFDNFARIQKGAEDIRNASLNYCYAIIRGAIIRSLTNAGLMSAFGLHHQNYFNAFNLADDMIEPFRAFVDLHVKMTVLRFDDKVLTTALKAEYINILNLEYVQIDGGVSNLRVGIDICVQSLQKVILQNDTRLIIMPSIDFQKYEDECI